MKKLFLLLVAVLSVSLCAAAQSRSVSGTVVDESGEPMAGVSVVPVGQKTGVVSDADGNFTISVGSHVKALEFSFVGYKNKMEDITKGRMIVHMEPSVEMKDEVIVVAYGQTKRSAYTGSAGVVKADQLENTQTSNVVNALSGKVAGVTLQQSNGQPGTVATVLIRGVGTINASASPLYVLDGVPLNSADDMAAVSPNDIAEMTVLKDAASTALYGARGANGVILVTTKKGAEGNAKVTVDMRLGSNSRAISRYNTINDPRQYIETIYKAHFMTASEGGYYANNFTTDEQRHAYANSMIWPSIGYQTWTVPEGQDIVGINGKFNPNATPGYVSGNYLYLADNWAKETLIHGMRQEYSMNVTGGTNKLKYFVSASYLGDEGIIKSSSYDRFTSRVNVDYQAKTWLKVSTNMSYSYQNTNYPGEQTLDYATSVGNAFNMAYNIGPVYPIYVRQADGTIMFNENYGKPVYDYGDGKDYGLGRTPVRNTYNSSNPVGDLQFDSQEYLSDVFNGIWSAEITPLEGLRISGTAGLNVDNTRFHYVKNPFYGSGVSYKGQAIQAHDRYRTINLNAMAFYSRNFGDHYFDVMASFENTSFNVEEVEAVGSNLYQPTSPYINNTIDQKTGYGYAANLVHRGFLARANYNYASKYYVSASIRRDGSSRFHKSKRWGTFWSASAGWDIAKENFLRESTAVDMLKFKFSFGQTGNDGIGSNYLAWDDQYTISGADGIWSDGTLYYKGNKDITWETSNSLNTGFDFSFFKGALSGSIEYYQRETKDMLFRVPVAPSLGYSTIPMNNGSMRNNGFEIDLNWRAVNTKDVTLNIFANVTTGWNKVLKLNQDILNTHADWRSDSQLGWLSGNRIFFEGQSMYNYWTIEYAGVNNDPERRRLNAAGTALDGDLIPLGAPLYKAMRPVYDDNGDPVWYKWHYDDKGEIVGDEQMQEEYLTDNASIATNTNRKATGNLMPKAYGGFGFNLEAYGIDFSASFAYQLGGRVFDSAYQTYMYGGSTASIGQALHKDMLNAWSPNNMDTDVPRLATEVSVTSYSTTSTRWLTSSNYLSLNNVTLGYTLPAKWTTQIGINSVRFYCTAENVALWSRRKGLDPRQSYVSSNNATYSPIRSISGGIRVSF